MEGMIHKANRVLDHAAISDRKGALKKLFQKAKGIILISVVESGLILSVAGGVGIMMTKNEDTEEWSPPCACGMASASWGFSLGAVMKDVIIFALDDKSVQAFTSQLGFNLGVATSVTLGKIGLNAGANVNLSKSGTQGTMNLHNLGMGGTVSIAFCQGAYVSASVSGAVVAPNVLVNRSFYDDATLSAEGILFGDDVDVPNDKFSPALQAIYGKLQLLSQGCNNYLADTVESDEILHLSQETDPTFCNSSTTEENLNTNENVGVQEAARRSQLKVEVAKSCRTEEETLAMSAATTFLPLAASIIMPT